jgi:hypothetical protein
MSSTLTVIALVMKLRNSSQTTSGEAIYKEMVTRGNTSFTFKQFVNAQNEYNEKLT